LVLCIVALPALAQTPVKDTAHTGVRKVKKATHRVTETLCTGTRAACAAGKLKNRVTETRDVVRDEAVKARQ
jgi:muramoyltetrapeptide carboxypeptidase LdcA involved in peptidoglycan recycling